MTEAGHGWPRRRLFGTAMGLAAFGSVALAAPGMVAGAQRGRWEQPLRFGSFNIHHGASQDGELDLERVARRIEALDCDVVGLQEVERFWRRSDFVDQSDWLGGRLGWHVAFGRNERHEPDEVGRPRREYGTAVLSRWPITEAANTRLPGSTDRESRGLLRTVLDAPGGPLTFANTHLTHEDRDERLEQAHTVVAELGEAPRRTVLVGDLNARPGSAPVDAITGHYTDVWDAVGRGDGHSFPAREPYKRIDYVFVSSDLKPRSARVDDAEPDASDHLPLTTVVAATP